MGFAITNYIQNYTAEIERLNIEIKYLKENHNKVTDLHLHHIFGHAGNFSTICISYENRHIGKDYKP